MRRPKGDGARARDRAPAAVLVGGAALLGTIAALLVTQDVARAAQLRGVPGAVGIPRTWRRTDAVEPGLCPLGCAVRSRATRYALPAGSACDDLAVGPLLARAPSGPCTFTATLRPAHDFIEVTLTMSGPDTAELVARIA